MSKIEFKVSPLFAAPIFRADLSSAISPEQIKYIQNLKMVRNRNNEISEDLYIFKHKQLASIGAAVQAALDVYASEVMGIAQELYVTQSWALTNQPGVGMHAHSHSNSIISGSLYYCDLPKPDAKVIFDRHTTYQQLELRPLVGKQNIYNTPVNAITPNAGEVLMFPSEINHMVEVNESNKPRRAIAFNAFIRGKIGDYRDVSELTI